MLDGAVTLSAGDEEYRLEPRSLRASARTRTQAAYRRRGRRCLRSAGTRRPLRAVHLHERGRAGPTHWLTSRSSGSGEFEAIFGGGFHPRRRAGLGVGSMGIAVMDTPAGATAVPGARPGTTTGEVYALGPGDDSSGSRSTRSGRVWIRVGEAESAQDRHRRGAGAGARDRRLARARIRPSRVHRGGRTGSPRREARAVGAANSRRVAPASGTGPRRRRAGARPRRPAVSSVRQAPARGRVPNSRPCPP